MNDMQKTPQLDDRMAKAASLVREGATIADVGTDHGYLPISLLRAGKIRRAAASDIHRGPLMHAMANAKKYGVADQIRFFLSDGLQNIPLQDMGITDIVICGMGGEGIARILSESAYVRNAKISLILQPMSATEKLRAYLAGAGFAITEERIAASKGKLYQCICAQYDGIPKNCTPAELLLGKQILQRGAADPLFSPLLQKYIQKTRQEYTGKLQGDAADGKQTRFLLEELLQIAKDKGI